jgi:hypothetical protein
VDRYAGLGKDARRTERARELLAAGIHPLTRLPLHVNAAPPDRVSPGLRCRDCSHRYLANNPHGDYWKCDQAAHQGGSEASDCRGWWSACRLFEQRITE